MITKEDMHNFYFQYIVREDLDGDPLLSLNLLEAAEDKDWQRVETLLEQGADPRICRSTDNNCVESALVMALAARRYDIAKKLYDAGDRLDDHEGFTDAEWDGEIIDFFSLSELDKCPSGHYLKSRQALVFLLCIKFFMFCW